MHFGVLGPLEVADGGERIRIGGTKLRALLATLLVHANEVVTTDRLLTALWPSSPSSKGLLNTLQSHVSRLRTIIDPAADGGDRRLSSQGSGYLLRVDRDELDALTFEKMSRQVRDALAASEWDTVTEVSEAALRCWRGRALEEFRDAEFARHRASQLEEERLLTIECSLEAGLALGRHRELITQLEDLVIKHPLRESLWVHLMVALYRSGRQADALRAYDRVRRHLAEELGIDPCSELVDVRKRVLDHDSSLDWTQPEPATTNPSVTASPAPTRLPPSDDPVDLCEADRPIRHNLPRYLTMFVGRQSERLDVAKALSEARLLTLTGAGGCGKTRLALAVAEDVLAKFPDGVWFVDLSHVGDSLFVERAVAAALGVETGETSQLDHLCRRIGHRALLLVLDNCEHIVEPVALLGEELLVRCPALRVLATSREELRVGGEKVWRVPPLSLPGPNEGGSGAAYLNSEAVQLFIQRGRSAMAGFSPSGEALGQVAQICRHLDGVPLAIELAAALVSSLPVANIAERLDDRFRLLSQWRRRSPGRHRTLRATLDWSFELLDEPAQDLFVRLSVFVGDFSLAAAETIAGTKSDSLAVARGLRHLVATSMVSFVADKEGASRYRMLETVRQYAQERLERLEIADEIRERHARYYADFAEEAESHVHGPAAPDWLALVVSELPNLRAAVAWAIESDDTRTGLRLAGSLRWYFDRMGLLNEAARWLDVWLSGGDLPLELRLRALTAASNVAFMQGEFRQTEQFGEEGIALARQLQDDHQLELALIVRGSAAVYEGSLDRAEECFEEAEALCSRLGDQWGMAWNHTGWAIGCRRRGQLDRARRHLVDALDIFRSVNDRHGQVLPLVHLALAAQEEGQTYNALAFASDALQAAQEVRDRKLQHIALCVLGRVELSLDHLNRARELLVRSIRGFVGSHHRLMVAIALEGLAGLSGLADRHDEAAALLGFTEQMRERGQIALSSARAGERAAWLDSARAAIGERSVDRALDRGRAMSIDDALDRAEVATASFVSDDEPVSANTY